MRFKPTVSRTLITPFTLILLLVTASVTLLTGCASYFGSGIQGPHVVVYTPFPHRTAKELARVFEQRTGIKVIQVLEGTTKVYSRLQTEKHNPRADVWYGGGGMIPFIAAAHDGLLAPYIPKGWDKLPINQGNLILRDPEWRWVGMVVIALGYAYNPQITPPSQLPHTWDELADPRWKNQIEMWDPASSGTAMLFLDASLLRYINHGRGEEAGWKYLARFYKNLKPYTVEGKPAFNVARGHTKIGIHFGHQVIDFIHQQGGEEEVDSPPDNIRWYLPPESPVIVDPIALIKGAPHPKEAKKFIDFVLSKEGQAIVNKLFFTIDPSFPPPPLLGGITRKDLESRALKLNPQWMAKRYDDIRRRWQNEIEAMPK